MVANVFVVFFGDPFLVDGFHDGLAGPCLACHVSLEFNDFCIVFSDLLLTNLFVVTYNCRVWSRIDRPVEFVAHG